VLSNRGLGMLETEELSYKIKKYERVAEVEGLRVSILTLAAGNKVPWHRHTYIEDQFVCMEGPMQVDARQPDEAIILKNGDTLKIAAGRPHSVMGFNGGPCRFMIIQGVGKYDFVPCK